MLSTGRIPDRPGGRAFYIGKEQHEYWKRTPLIIEVVDWMESTFSVEGTKGKAF